jgi:hypothetical protein
LANNYIYFGEFEIHTSSNFNDLDWIFKNIRKTIFGKTTAALIASYQPRSSMKTRTELRSMIFRN